MGVVNREDVLNREGQHVFSMRKSRGPPLGKGLEHQEMAIKTEVLGVSQEHLGDQCSQSSVSSRRLGCRAQWAHRPYSFVSYDKDFGLSS